MTWKNKQNKTKSALLFHNNKCYFREKHIKHEEMKQV